LFSASSMMSTSLSSFPRTLTLTLSLLPVDDEAPRSFVFRVVAERP
jgi:hypothetical protein